MKRQKLTLEKRKSLKKEGICWKCQGSMLPKSKEHVCSNCLQFSDTESE